MAKKPNLNTVLPDCNLTMSRGGANNNWSANAMLRSNGKHVGTVYGRATLDEAITDLEKRVRTGAPVNERTPES